MKTLPDCRVSRHYLSLKHLRSSFVSLPPFSLIRDFRKQNTCGNVPKIFVNHTCYRKIGSKSISHSRLALRKERLKVTIVAVIGGFRFDLSMTRKTDGNFGNVSASVLLSTKTVVTEGRFSKQRGTKHLCCHRCGAFVASVAAVHILNM